MGVFSPDGGFYHTVLFNNFIKPSDGTSKCSIYITMINQELYLEVKNKWKSLYPIYFDASKTIQEGRRLALDQCIKNPTLEEVIRAVCACKLRHIIEPHKSYSRDYFQMGRLKVQLLHENGKPVHGHMPNKKKMLQNVAKQLRELRAKK